MTAVYAARMHAVAAWNLESWLWDCLLFVDLINVVPSTWILPWMPVLFIRGVAISVGLLCLLFLLFPQCNCKLFCSYSYILGLMGSVMRIFSCLHVCFCNIYCCNPFMHCALYPSLVSGRRLCRLIPKAIFLTEPTDHLTQFLITHMISFVPHTFGSMVLKHVIVWKHFSFFLCPL